MKRSILSSLSVMNYEVNGYFWNIQKDKRPPLPDFHSVINEMFISIIPCNLRHGKILHFTRIWIGQILNLRSTGILNSMNVYEKLNTYICAFFWEKGSLGFIKFQKEFFYSKQIRTQRNKRE